MGALGLSVAWIIILVILTWVLHQEAFRRQSMANHVFLNTALQDKTVFMRLIQDIPDWVKQEQNKTLGLSDFLFCSFRSSFQSLREQLGSMISLPCPGSSCVKH